MHDLICHVISYCVPKIKRI